MKIRTRLSLLVIALLLLAPAAHGEEAAPETGTATEAAAPDTETAVGGLQQQVVDEDKSVDDGEPKATKVDVEGVHAEVEVLRDQWQRSLTRAYPTTVVQSNRPLVISGIGQLRYDNTFNQVPNNPSSFSIPFFSLSFTGNLRKDYLEGKNVDYSLGIQTTGTAAISITDAWLSYQILNSLDSEGPRLSITAGQQKKNFGNEATATEAFQPTIKLAQFASNLGLANRDIGLVLAGDLLPAVDFSHNYRVPLAQYWVGLVNGNGPNTVDNNNNKYAFARIQINAPVDYDHPLRGLSLGFSGYNGLATASATTTITNSLSSTTAPAYNVTSTSTSSITQNGKSQRWGADLAYVNTPVGFTLEYVRAQDPLAANGTGKNGAVTKPAAISQVNEEAYTFTLFYNFGDQFVTSAKAQDRYDDYYPLTYQPFFRFDRWVPDTSNYGVHTDIFTGGFNWFFAQTTKLQLNYNYKQQYAATQQNINHEFLAQFQFGF